MATIINTPGNSDGADNSMMGWAVAVIILLVVIVVGAYVWVNYRPAPETTPANNEENNGGASVNITIPGTGGNSSSSEDN